MTDRSDSQDGGRPTIQLIVHGDRDRKALEEFLDKRYDVTCSDTLQPVDCYLLGERMVPTYREPLQAHKKAAHPTFTPVLLIQEEGSRGRVPLPSEQGGDGPPLIDEVMSAPVDRLTLFRRVGNLLARREQSVELSDRYEDIRTRFQRLFNSTNDALFVARGSDHEITECNPAASDLVGYTREELLSVSLVEIIHADDHGRLQSFLRDVQDAGEGSTDGLTCQTKDGELRQLEVSAAKLEDTTQSPIILSVRDVTERKTYERELELKSQAMDEAPVGISISDPDQADNPMIYVNKGFEAVTGYSKSEAVGRNCRFLQGERTREEPVAEMRQAIDEAQPVSAELRNYRKDGSQFWNRVSIAPVRDDTGAVTNYIGFQEDVSERKEREQDLQLFKKAVENVGHTVFITDREGTIQYVNPVFEERTGYTRAEAVGQTPRLLNSGKQDDEFYERMWQTILSGEQWEAQLVNRRKNGELYYVDQMISPITNDVGEITHFVTIESDVTNRWLRKQQLEVLNRVLRHDLRNGTNVIEGNANMLQNALDDEALKTHTKAIEERTEALSRVSEQARRVNSLFDDELPTEAICNITQLVTEVVNDVSETYPDATVSIAEHDTVHARADSRLKTALTELLDNAIIHNDQSTPEVTIAVRPSNGERTGEWVEIVVADNGPGIPDHEKQTIESGKETPLQHGTGLGLWIVYWTVSLFGGEVSLEANSPRGTRVVLNLPQASVDSSRQVTPAEPH